MKHQGQMDTHSLKVLEFDKIREFLKFFAASPGGKKLCETLCPCTEKNPVESLLKETTEMRLAVELQGDITLNDIKDIRNAVNRSRVINFYLEPESLYEIKCTIETAESVRKYFLPLKETCPCLFRISEKIPYLASLSALIKKSISPEGLILDSASPALADIRNQLKKLRVSIIKTLEQMLNHEYISHAIQDDFITIRNNRYVIPVRTDSKSMVQGVVHDQSQSKATFFIEPMSVVQLNNELQMQRKEEYYEEVRILRDITKQVRSCSDDILAALDIVERIDMIHAKAAFSRAMNAVEPEINDQGIIDCRQCRHPILLSEFIEDKPEDDNAAPDPSEATAPAGHFEFKRQGIVPIDLVKNRAVSALIITGANAGGKTVALKTLGLLVLMTQSGIHIPAEEGSRIAVYENVYADIGDEQNIETSLSTFSAHMEQIRYIIENVSPSSLILLDEIGSGTDPSEGGALAVAIIDHLIKKGGFIVATTHLNILKTYAYNHAGAENVSVEFDPATLKPTYNLVYGVPGISNPLAIAASMGIPGHILRDAENYIDKTDRQITGLIQGLEKTRKELLEEQRQLKRIIDAAIQSQEASEALLERMKSRKDQILKNFEDRARKLLRESEDQLADLIKKQKRLKLFRPSDVARESEKNRQNLSEIKQNLHKHIPKPQPSMRPFIDHLSTGQHVRVQNFKKPGIVISVDNRARKAEIAIGTLRIKTGFNDVEIVESSPTESREINFEHGSTTTPVPDFTAGGHTIKINVIGLRSHEAITIVDKTIDKAILQGASAVEIIHGRGTGRLKNSIHEYLNTSPHIKSFVSADVSQGGSGVTIVQMQ